MKNFTLITLCAALLFSLSAQSQECSDLFISEVVEGWSNNKAIEIYNPTAFPIDATEYGLVRFQNGSADFGNITYLTDVIIAPYDVHVMVIDKTDPDGEGLESMVWDELFIAADAFYNPEWNNGQEVMYFNGNDALALLKDEGEVLVDLFGKIADALNPDGWDAFGTNDEGEAIYISEDHTLVRKNTVTQGVTLNPESFETLLEYDSLSANTFTELGFHNCDCDVTNILEVEKSKVKLFPNPSEDGMVMVSADQLITKIQVYNLLGVIVEEILVGSQNSVYTDLTTLKPGSYFLNVNLENGEEINQVLIRK